MQPGLKPLVLCMEPKLIRKTCALLLRLYSKKHWLLNTAYGSHKHNSEQKVASRHRVFGRGPKGRGGSRSVLELDSGDRYTA